MTTPNSILICMSMQGLCIKPWIRTNKNTYNTNTLNLNTFLTIKSFRLFEDLLISLLLLSQRI